MIRGVIALGESLAIGFRALAISANYAMHEEGETGPDGKPTEVPTEISRGQIIFSFVIAIGFALMLFKVDENLHADAAELLRLAGHDAVTVLDQGLRGHADGEIADVCRIEQRAIVTLDLDCSTILPLSEPEPDGKRASENPACDCPVIGWYG